jgi:colanic acid/amylovoran biosynthesis glycosyltransferase
MEAFGLVAAEAQAAGTPVVAYDSGGLGEAVSAGVGGLLVPEGDIRTLSVAIAHLLGDPGQAEAMGRAGRDWVRAERNIEIQTRRLEAIYDEVAAR